MKKFFSLFVVLIASVGIFGQTVELTDSLKKLKNSLEKYVTASPVAKYKTGFKAKNFTSCEVIFKFENYNEYVSTNQLPLNGPNNSPVVSNPGQQNPVFLRDRADPTIVYRNAYPNQNISVRNAYQPFFVFNQKHILNLSNVDLETINLVKDSQNDIYFLDFAMKSKDSSTQSANFVGLTNHRFFLKTEDQRKLDDVLDRFKKVVTLCQTN